MKLDNLLQAINLADMDNNKELIVTIDDLQLLRKAIKLSRSNEGRLNNEIHILQAKVALMSLEKSIKLDYYA